MSQDAPHILVTGDAWQYVPFGRARIKALRATGLSYASQTFSINGATIKVRIAGKQSFISADGGGALYMETGQLEWGYPAELSPTKNDPAKWHFMDIPTTDKYLGSISSSGAQTNKPALAENQDSLAIGYPKAKTGTPAEKAVKDAATALAYSASTIEKKLIAAYWPASLFSGKMRLFMQAQYGSAETLKPKLKLGLSGTSPTLSYVSNEIPVQFGFWPHLTTGIFRAPGGAYFLINIALAIDGASTVVTYYPILLGAAGGALASAYKAAVSDEAKAQAEAYLFSSCVIQTSKGKTITLPIGAKGTTLAYGWKFNSDGSEARIVVHETLNAGTSTVRWKSTTVTVNLTYAQVDGVGVVSATATAMANGNWIDGWGTYNIFAPDTEIGYSPLSLKSLRVGSPRQGTDFVFTNVEVYGYYVVDAWTPVTMSYSVDSTARYTQTSNALFTNPEDALIPGNYQYSYNFANVPLEYSQESITDSAHMNVTVAGVTYGGAVVNGSFNTHTTDPQGGSSTVWTFSANKTCVGSSYGTPTPPGYVYGSSDGLGGRGFIRYGTMTAVTTTFTGTKYHAWALVIPGADCCAAYVATRQSDGAGTYTRTTISGPSITSFYGDGYDFVPYRYVWQFGGEGTPGGYTTVVDTPPIPPAVDAIECFNTVISGAVGDPGGSLNGLFDVSYLYPYYDRGMYTFTSHGKRYVMSEGLKSPSSAYYDRRFVGWA